MVKEKKKTKKRKCLNILIILIVLAIIGLITFGFMLYGPFAGFRDWLITCAMTTRSHQYFATWFYDEDTINESLNKNRVQEIQETTDTNHIVIEDKEEVEVKPVKIEYKNEYEKMVLEKDPLNPDYKIVDIKGKGYTGKLAIIYDPSRISTIYTRKLGTSGQYLTRMAKDNGAKLAINGGGFEDPNFNSNGANPVGITISNGKVITDKPYTNAGGLIGFTEDNKLVLGRMTAKQALAKNIRDAVTFGPFLIVNGKSSEVLGNGGWGTAPRTAIGQRKDGIVLMLVIDGRTISRPGADMNDLIEIMENYGAYNAANLDGGTSSVMVKNGELITDPVDSTGAHKTRFISTGFMFK